jgi:hypothetical protein
MIKMVKMVGIRTSQLMVSGMEMSFMEWWNADNNRECGGNSV